MACSIQKQQSSASAAAAASPASTTTTTTTTTTTVTAATVKQSTAIPLRNPLQAHAEQQRKLPMQQQQQQQQQLQQQQQQQHNIPHFNMNTKSRGSLPTNVLRPPMDLPWPPTPVSTHTSNLRLNMMNQNPKDLHTARLLIEELRSKVRYQTEHIMKWRKAYALQIQQHYRYQKEKTEQMNGLTSQLLLLESRLKRKQKQISNLLNHRELTIQRQQKIIDTLATRLVDHGLETIEASYATTELDSLNDSDSAVVLEDIDSDTNMTFSSFGGSGVVCGGSAYNSGRRRSSGSGACGDGISIARSISDAIETNLNKYSGVRRANCYLRRPEILETVYSVEEAEEPTSDVAEKRDKFRNRSEKALSSSSIEGQIDAITTANAITTATTTTTVTTPPPNILTPSNALKCSTPLVGGVATNAANICVTITAADNDDVNAVNVINAPTIEQLKTIEKTKENNYEHNARRLPSMNNGGHHPLPPKRQHSSPTDNYTAYNMRLQRSLGSVEHHNEEVPVKTQVTNFNRVMSNHRSVTKPKDVKYKRINKAKSKSLEELRGRLKNIVERGTEMGSTTAVGVMSSANQGAGGGGGAGGVGSRGGRVSYQHGMLHQTAQSYA